MIDYLAPGTCRRRDIRCAIFDKDKRLLGKGFNGPVGLYSHNCTCPGANVKAGAGSSTECYGMHAEVRALTQAVYSYKTDCIHYCLSTKAPCRACVLLLLGTPCQEILFVTASNETENRELWEKAGRKWTQVTQEEFNVFA